MRTDRIRRLLRRAWPGIMVTLFLTSAPGPSEGAIQGRPCPDTCVCDAPDIDPADLYGTDIVLGAPVERCPQLDLNRDGQVTVAELVTWHVEGSAAAAAALAAGGAAAPGEVTLTVGTASGGAGSTVTVPLTIDTGGLVVVGWQTDISFDPLTLITGCGGGAYQPFGCTPGVNCTAFRLLRLRPDPIPDGPVGQCTIQIHPTAPLGSYPLTNSNFIASSPIGQRLPMIAIDGAVIVIADLDGDGVPDDDDNCATIANADQADFDGDLVGDVCDDIESATAVGIRAARLRPDTNGRGNLGYAKIRASLGMDPVGQALIADVPTHGLRIVVRDGADFETTLLFDRCQPRGTRIRCRGGDNGLAVLVLRERAGSVELRVTAPRLPEAATGSNRPAGPVELIVSSAAKDHSGAIATCRGARLNSLACTAP